MRRIITLCLTNNCNLCCSYCYEKAKNGQSMSIETAKEIVLKNLPNEDDELIIDFFGGEPFLCFDVMQALVAYIKENFAKKKISFTISTNATLVHGEIQRWLINNPEVICNISIDGTPEMHNKNRSNSFNLIDLSFFIHQYTHPIVKMTISPETLPSLSDGIIYLTLQGLDVKANLAYGADWSNPNFCHIFENELLKLISFYLKNSHYIVSSILDDSIIIYEKKDFNFRWCGCGNELNAYDIDGKRYNCQYFMPFSIGNQKAQTARSIVIPAHISCDMLDKKCRTCSINQICPSCLGANYATFSNVYTKDPHMCKLFKILIKARAYFNAQRIKQGIINIDDKTKYLLIKSILKIQDGLDV